MQQAGKRARAEQLRWAESPAAARPRALCVWWSCCCCCSYFETLSGGSHRPSWCQPSLAVSSSKRAVLRVQGPISRQAEFGPVRSRELEQTSENPSVSLSGPSACWHTPRRHHPLSLFLFSFSWSYFLEAYVQGGWSVCQAAFQATSHSPHTFTVRSPVLFLFNFFASAPPSLCGSTWKCCWFVSRR